MSGRPMNTAMVTLSIMAATVMQALDTTIANVALPHMQGSLTATQDQVTWVLTSYIVAAAVMTPPTGWLAARFGRKRLFALAVTGFTLASMLCGVAQNLGQMVGFRLLQGVFGAALVPLSQATLFDTYPPAQHGKAMALWGIGVMVGPILGPTLGGWLTENWNWRWVFYINLPFGILSLLGILSFVPETPPDRSRRLDAFGFAMLSLGIGALQMMLDRGELKGWFGSGEIIAEAVAAVAGSYFFLAHSLTTAKPFLNPATFKDRNMLAGLINIFIVGVILYATLSLMPPFLQSLKGYPVITTGVVLAPRGVGTLISMIVVGRLVGRVDTRLLLLAGFSLLILSLWQMAGWTLEVSIFDIVESGLIQGLGIGLVMPPLSAVSFSTLPTTLRTEAAGIFSLIRNIGGSIGISVVEALLDHNTQVNHSTLVEHLTPFNPVIRALPPFLRPDHPAGLAALNDLATQQAAAIATFNDFRLIMWLALLALPTVLILRPPKRAAAHATVAMD